MGLDVTETTLNAIIDLATPKNYNLQDRPYTSRPVHPVKTPLAATMGISTLTGIADYLSENPDGLELDHLFVHIESARNVQLRSRLTGPFEERNNYLSATCKTPVFEFGRYMDVETFIVALQALFLPCDTRDSILQITGNLTDEMITIYADDGVTQAVNTKNGLGRAEQTALPNPVTLRPWRTFGEVEQPVGQFVLRMKSGSGTNTSRPAIALYEADGGMWEMEAMTSIRCWLRETIPNEVAILA